MVRKIKEKTAGDESVPSILLFSDFESSACFGCGAGFHYISVNNDGQVTPCVAVQLAFENIHNSSLQEIYSTIMGELFQIARDHVFREACEPYGQEAGNRTCVVPISN